jgi:hypothetical protein
VGTKTKQNTKQINVRTRKCHRAEAEISGGVIIAKGKEIKLKRYTKRI